MPVEKETVLVTGSSGFIGSALIRRLASDYTIIGFDRPGVPHPPEEAIAVDVDLTSDEDVEAGCDRVLEEHGPELAAVVHLAAYYDFSGEPSPKYDAITVKGTERLFRCLRSFRLGQFQFSSTMLVHAPCEPGGTIDESWPLEPKWDYPRSKLDTELLLRDIRGDVPIALLRVAGVYDDRCRSIPLAQQMQRIAERKITSHLYPGDTDCGQAFLHLDDLVEAIALAVRRRGDLPPEETLLIGEPETLSYEELQKMFGRLIHDEDWDTTRIPKAVAKTGAWLQDNVPFTEEPFIKPWMIDLADDHYALDIGRAREHLGWEPRRTLRETVPRMVEAYRSDPAGWYEDNDLEPPDDLKKASGER